MPKPGYREHNGISEHVGEWRGEGYQFRLRLPKGRRDYCCDYCGEDIPKGERHVAFVTVNEEGPGWATWRLHGECYLSGGAMFDNSGRPSWRWADGEWRPDV